MIGWKRTMKNLEIQAAYCNHPGRLLCGKSKIRKVVLEKSWSNRYTYCQAALMQDTGVCFCTTELNVCLGATIPLNGQTKFQLIQDNCNWFLVSSFSEAASKFWTYYTALDLGDLETGWVKSITCLSAQIMPSSSSPLPQAWLSSASLALCWPHSHPSLHTGVSLLPPKLSQPWTLAELSQVHLPVWAQGSSAPPRQALLFWGLEEQIWHLPHQFPLCLKLNF